MAVTLFVDILKIPQGCGMYYAAVILPSINYIVLAIYYCCLLFIKGLVTILED